MLRIIITWEREKIEEKEELVEKKMRWEHEVDYKKLKSKLKAKRNVLFSQIKKVLKKRRLTRINAEVTLIAV